jgi:hypothetical protein
LDVEVNCLRREITGENGIHREIPEEKTDPPGDFACRREISRWAVAAGRWQPKRFKYIIYIEKKLILKVVKKAVPLFFIMADSVGPEYNDSPTDGYEFPRNICIHTVCMYSMYAEVLREKS